MDLKDTLLQEALKLEQRAAKIREAAKLLNGTHVEGPRRAGKGHKTRRKCEHCGAGFLATRKDARFCSRPCVCAAYRKRLFAKVAEGEGKRGKAVAMEVSK